MTINMVKKIDWGKQDNLTPAATFQRARLGKQGYETVCVVTAKPY